MDQLRQMGTSNDNGFSQGQSGPMQYLQQIIQYHPMLAQIIFQQVTLRYRRTILGYLWTLIHPVLMISVTAVVFAGIFKIDLKTYAVFLFSGMIAFNLFSTIVIQCGQSLLNNESLIKKVYIPKFFFPLAVSLTLFFDSILMCITLLGMLWLLGGNLSVSWALASLLPAYVLLYGFALGMGLINSILSVYFRDLLHIMGICMQALVFLSPVYYKPEHLSARVGFLLEINPLTPFIRCFRMPVYEGYFPPAGFWSQAVMYAAVSLLCGLWFFSRFEHRVTFRM